MKSDNVQSNDSTSLKIKKFNIYSNVKKFNNQKYDNVIIIIFTKKRAKTAFFRAKCMQKV